MDCNGCTLCCKLFQIEWMNSPAGEYCRECESGVRCKIYNNAPKECLEFYCAYNQMERVSINLRPDKCGVIFYRMDDIMMGWVDPEVENLGEPVLKQLDYFKDEGFSLVLFKQGNKPYIHSEKYTEKELIEKMMTELIEFKWQHQTIQQIYKQ